MEPAQEEKPAWYQEACHLGIGAMQHPHQHQRQRHRPCAAFSHQRPAAHHILSSCPPALSPAVQMRRGEALSWVQVSEACVGHSPGQLTTSACSPPGQLVLLLLLLDMNICTASNLPCSGVCRGLCPHQPRQRPQGNVRRACARLLCTSTQPIVCAGWMPAAQMHTPLIRMGTLRPLASPYPTSSFCARIFPLPLSKTKKNQLTTHPHPTTLTPLTSQGLCRLQDTERGQA